jgi:predicted ATPase/DNA-binding CsgD family transcriptional regulator
MREAAGLTQEQLAEKAGLSVQGIASLESGRSRRPYPHTLRALGDALGLSSEQHAALLATIPGRNKPAGAPTAAAAGSSRDARLPLLVTDLIGRERELDGLGDILRQGARILTLTGPGGVGKTSLALRLAVELSHLYPDGVIFVPLAPVGDASLVIPTIVHTLQLPETGARAARDSLQAYLRDRRMLLVLDNFEQVLAAASEVSGLASSSDGLAILVTSRAPLRVRGEQEYPVQPLEVPELTRVPVVGDVVGNPSVELFVDRVRAAVPSFQLGRENAAAIAAICRRLDGLPLAIELAAARVRVLSPTALLSRLDSALPLLSGGARDLPERQQTMRRAIEWSYELLDEPERMLFNTLSVFRGGWTLDAAEAVGAGEHASAEDVLGFMSSLVEQSLVVTGNQEDGSFRYRLLVPVREFAEEHLERTGGAGEVRRRHAEYYLALSEQAATELTGPRQVEWLSRLEMERDNLRAAVNWLLGIQDCDAAIRLVWNLWVFWWIRGYHGEVRGWMTQVLEEVPRLPSIARAQVLGTSGAMALAQGDIASAEMCCEESRSLFNSVGDDLSAARMGLTLGLTGSAKGDSQKAGTWLGEAADVFRNTNTHFWAALAVSALGMLAFRQGDYERAETLLAEGHGLARKAGDRFSRYIALYNQSRLAQSRGNVAEAAGLFREGLMFSLEVGDRANTAYCLEGLAAVAAAQGDTDRAARLLGAAHALFEMVGARVYTYRPDISLREQTMAAVQDQLDEDAWETAWAEGKSMPIDDVVTLATSLANLGEKMPDARHDPMPFSPDSKLISTYGLTPREVEVLRFLIAHRSYREIAEAMYISPRTVGTHITSIRNKLGVSSPREAARIAAELGLGGGST